jgi:hypothetical protein
MLRLQEGATQDPQLGALVRDSAQRIQALALVHDVLYRSRDLEHIELAAYLRPLFTPLGRAFHPERQHIRLHLDLTEISLDLNRWYSPFKTSGLRWGMITGMTLRLALSSPFTAASHHMDSSGDYRTYEKPKARR